MLRPVISSLVYPVIASKAGLTHRTGNPSAVASAITTPLREAPRARQASCWSEVGTSLAPRFDRPHARGDPISV